MSDLRGKDLSYQDGSGLEMVGHLIGHEDGARPGVVLFPDVWGASDHFKRRVRQVAALGYVALGADMYGGGWGKGTFEEAYAQVTQATAADGAVRRRARAAVEALRAQPGVDGGRLAAIGYCFGGLVVLELARDGADLSGVVSFHGGLETKSPARKGGVKAPVLVCTGGEDPRVPDSALTAFSDEMRAAGADWQINVYGGALHAFTVAESDQWGREGVGYHAAADRRSWDAMRAFFDEIFAVLG